MPLPERSAPRGPESRPVSERRAVAVSRRSGANAKNPVRAPSRDVRTIVISDRKSPRWSYHCDFSSNSSSSPSPTSHDIILPEPMTSSSRAQAIPGTVQTGHDVMRIFENFEFSRRTGHFSKIQKYTGTGITKSCKIGAGTVRTWLVSNGTTPLYCNSP